MDDLFKSIEEFSKLLLQGTPIFSRREKKFVFIVFIKAENDEE
jgi:hypothetical protein